jgi:hypothetical protein
MSNSLIFDWRIRGIPSDIWLRYADKIGQLITKEKLTPINSRLVTTPNQVNLALAGAASAATTATATMTRDVGKTKAISSATEWFDIRGGMKALHVHYNGEIYLLNEAQWKRFTTMVIDDFKAKLETAKVVGFDTTLDIAETIGRLG